MTKPWRDRKRATLHRDRPASGLSNTDRSLELANKAEEIGANDPRRVAASVAMFERLAEHWSLRWDERERLLGGIAKSTWSEWRQRPMLARIKPDARERIANLFTIDLNAHSLFAPEFADHWVRQLNIEFGGESPLAIMLRGKVEDVISVRRYLERVRTSSPAGSGSQQDVRPHREGVVSYLPGEAVGVDDDTAAIPALRQAAAIYEQLALREPERYGPVFGATLSTLATSLEQEDAAEAAPLFRRAAQVVSEANAESRAFLPESDRLRSTAEHWQTELALTAADSFVKVAMLDSTLLPALVACFKEIEADPFVIPLKREGGIVRVAHLMHHGVTWTITFTVSEAERLVTVFTIQPDRAK
ncbi:MAG: hypothetical protein JWM87_3996 [Candidatus Eremiobacteraeota bacterium]|nr:hypothetical protein [Candidatus Eremiobacteraeota bacterium]